MIRSSRMYFISRDGSSILDVVRNDKGKPWAWAPRPLSECSMRASYSLQSGYLRDCRVEYCGFEVESDGVRPEDLPAPLAAKFRPISAAALLLRM